MTLSYKKLWHRLIDKLEGQKMSLPAKLLSLSYFRTDGTPSTAHPEYWNGSIPWVSARDFKTFRFEDSEDHVAELALAEINAVHEWICAEDSEKGGCQALFYVRRTIQNGWNRDMLRNWLSTNLYEREGKKISPRGILGCDVLCLNMFEAELFFYGCQFNGKVFWQKM